MQQVAHHSLPSRPSALALRRTVLLAAVATTFLLGRAFGWPGPEDGDPGPTDNLDSLSYTDTLGQDGTQESSVALAVAGAGGAGGHYFISSAGQPVPLVGVSADNACHFNITGTGQCNYTNYTQKISDDLADGLNVIRLWVNVAGLPANGCAFMSGAADPTDQPFTYSASPQQSDGLGRWYLDAKNTAYFQRLSTVVSYAAANNMYVEITFFSPQTGTFYLGPWSSAHSYLQKGTKLAGFSDPANFVNTASSQYTTMVPYLFNVIHWTVDTLHTFTNLYYEVANEPENVTLTQPQSPSCSSWGNHSETSPATVATWQAAIAAEAKRYESATYGLNHLIAVEPLTTTDAAPFMTGGADATAATIVNSHYTAINPTVASLLNGLGLGAIRLARQYNNQARVLGFNETKITGGEGCATAGTIQTVDEGRAEAWEFMVDQGGIYDQFGYDCYAADYTETRREMGILRTFLSTTVNIGRNMMTSSSTSPSWVNPGPYKAQEPATGSQKYWAAVEPTASAATKRWLLYVHHSTDRERIYDGYQEVSTSNAYQENLSVCLGAASGSYRAQWIDPKNAVLNGAVQTLQAPTPITWAGDASCTPGGSGAFTLPNPPHYSYDIALLISP